MSRRGSMKVALQGLSWLAVMRMLKKVPKSLPSTGMETPDVVMKAIMGCRTRPETDSLRYADDCLAGERRPNPGWLLPMMCKMSGCTSRPHTNSFRVHHVVNQEALQLMLDLDDDDNTEAFVEPYDALNDDELICSSYIYHGIDIRDGDRLLRDDHDGNSARAMSSSSSRLSSSSTCAGSGSCGISSSSSSSCCCCCWSSSSSVLTAPTALGRNSVDSDAPKYSTARSCHTKAGDLAGPHIMRSTCANSSRSSSTISSYYLQSSDKFSASELFSDDNSDHNEYLSEKNSVPWELLEELVDQEDREAAHEDVLSADLMEVPEERDNREYYNFKNPPALSVGAGDHDRVRIVDLVDPATRADEYLDECAVLHEYNECDDHGDDEGNGVAEVRYSKDPLEDFAESIGQMVMWQQQRKQPAQLHDLYRRYLRLNSPAHHATITLAFLHALQITPPCFSPYS